jgi:hypothetical protein
MMYGVHAQISNTAHGHRGPFTRSLLNVPADGSAIALRSLDDIVREFELDLLVDEKLAQASHIYNKSQDAEHAMRYCVMELEEKMMLVEQQIQSNTSRLPALRAAAPAADGAPAADTKPDPQQQAAIAQDPNFTLKMQLIDLRMQVRRTQADHERSIADQLQKLNAPNAATFRAYVEQAVENTSFSVLTSINQSVGSDNFVTLTQIARSHGYDSQGRAFDQVAALIAALHANSRRVDLLFVYRLHTGRMSVTKAMSLSVKEMLEIRRRERNDQDCYPLPLVAFQLMEMIEALDDVVFSHIKSKYSSLSVGQVTKQTILAAQDEILKIDSTKASTQATPTPAAARSARPPATAAAVNSGNPHSNQGGKSNFGQSHGQLHQPGGGKQPYKQGAGRYAPRTGDHSHGGDRRSQPSHSHPRFDESTRPFKSDAHLSIEDADDEGQTMPRTPAPGNA